MRVEECLVSGWFKGIFRFLQTGQTDHSIGAENKLPNERIAALILYFSYYQEIQQNDQNQQYTDFLLLLPMFENPDLGYAFVQKTSVVDQTI